MVLFSVETTVSLQTRSGLGNLDASSAGQTFAVQKA